jgi:hypothetical protein
VRFKPLAMTTIANLLPRRPRRPARHRACLVARRHPAEADRLVPHANKVRGFDCPGCAFPTRGPSAGRHLRAGTEAIAWEMTRKAVVAEFFQAARGGAARAVGSRPRVSRAGSLTRWSTRNTLSCIAACPGRRPTDRRARASPAMDPKSVAFYASGRSSNEAAFLWQLAGARLRQPQPARLLQLLPRAQRLRAQAEHRHRQGHLPARGFRARRPDHR